MTDIRDQLIPLASPDIREGDIDRVIEVLKSGMLVQGKRVLEAEAALSELIGASEISLVSNGTASLHLALIALGVGPGDEVIIPAFSYVATANVVELVGARCIFADISLKTFNIDSRQIEGLISARTKVIMPVHEFGLCADMTAIMKIADRHGIHVVEDAACALGARHGGRYAGTFGTFGSFSFHPRKSVTSGEGGCLVTSCPELHNRVRSLRNHGIAPNSNPIDFVDAGLNYRLTDIQAALLLGQLNRLDDALERRQNIAAYYLSEINHPHVVLPSVPEDANHSWQTFHILLESESQRNALSEFLRKAGVMSNYGAQCIPTMTYYRMKYEANALKQFPNAYRAYTCGLAIPVYEKLNDLQVNMISNLINNFK